MRFSECSMKCLQGPSPTVVVKGLSPKTTEEDLFKILVCCHCAFSNQRFTIFFPLFIEQSVILYLFENAILSFCRLTGDHFIMFVS